MTPKEITTLAGHRLVPPWVMKLALDVSAAEREACAKVCETDELCCKCGDECAAAIRGRGMDLLTQHSQNIGEYNEW